MTSRPLAVESEPSALACAQTETLNPKRSFPIADAAYLHIPFCRRRCHYCDFATGRGTTELIERYTIALCRQISQVSAPSIPLETVFFGGGTPSLLSPGQLDRILTALARIQPFSRTAEISLEANPGTVDRDKLQGFKDAGINRISLGVQAFQAHLLEACGRLHSVEDVFIAIADLRTVGFNSFNLDLIFGLPHQTLSDWQASLEAAIDLAPPHISLYDLTIEAGTRFGRLYQPGDRPLPSDESTVQMYEMAIAKLTAAGYVHYEVSNFAQPGHECRHNRVYWENCSYHGLGMGATGYIGGRRAAQPDTLADYFALVDSGQWPEADVVSLTEELADTLMLGLRLREGVAVAALEARFGSEAIAPVQDVLCRYVERGWVDLEGDRWRLVPPDGWLFSNTILVELLEAIQG